ncbi:iron-containing alcohol dehydrogenase [Eubacteriaceae bacterium ES3]|nr:iron-containing alcohol dehydrogenase [Eubacteriaceae bacterium ES3]
MELKKLAYRSTHVVMKGAMAVIKMPTPSVLSGPGMIKRFPEVIKACKVDHVLIVTDKPLMNLGLLDTFMEALKNADIHYTVFDGVQPNPTFENIEDGLAIYKNNHCNGIVAFGGGSSMDCAKIIGARMTNKKSIEKMKGLFKLTKKLPPFFAVPTTAGTGSEATIAAVITNSANHEKFAINDPKLVPIAACLDPELTIGLPNFLTAHTGMDALTHAVEAYNGWYDTPFVKEKALNATKIILNDLEKVYADGTNLELRENMLKASFDAGVAFTRAYVGYVHAIAHNLGGLYGVPHGFANAVILPHVLDFSKNKIEKKLSELAVYSGLGHLEEGENVLASRFINKVKEMNRNMDIPETIDKLKPEDIGFLTERILKEGNPTYPVPKIMDYDDCYSMLEDLVTPISYQA